MRYRAQDSGGDYILGAGNATFLNGLEAVAQAIKTKLLLFQEEWWENENEGLAMVQSILGVRGANKANADMLIVKRIKEAPEVLSVSDVSSVYDGSERSYTFQCQVQTTYGTLTVTNGG